MQFHLLRSEWDSITVEYGQMVEIGEFDAVMPRHGIAVAFAPHDRVTWSVDGGDRKTTALPPGSIFLYASRQFVWHHREKPSDWLHITLAPEFLSQIAIENRLSADLQLEHRIIFLDPTILHIAQLLKTEVVSGGIAGKLFVESLRNVLAIHLLRHYGQALKSAPSNDKRLSPLQIQQVKDHIEKHLAEDLSLAELAAIIPMSEFHFARLFKATTGEAPYRYITSVSD
ncbi:helix-turn-helix domain-containing protein [Thermocoleostomius sinensis]|uniref:AraC family transcriptional regulator n=1 Tax=Thermocoleostomius sinensis A174 TaxID=2016057 RepID=A0A9E8ZH88_9CYAN|nr:AraC family transcriptional regulator [Thermocoleostomius sinensis]WAL61784.1 AraC family transcriptional regulator [Thermocoleostomius sinensis A174]